MQAASQFEALLPAEIDKFPVYTRFERDTQGYLILPDDKNVLLSDKLVYAAMKELTHNEKGECRAMWDKNGEIRASRVAPRIDFHSVPYAI